MKTDEIYLQVISPDKVIFQGNVSLVRFPGKESPFVILRDHAPIMALLDKGVISYESLQGEGKIPVITGFVQVKDNRAYACVKQNENI